ncbi:unnamed protein product [Vicia faba]|uniref:Uncharacterized protein n=1 Tax=Vicia faba TaxID=3906 RepID=A0AAV1ABI4_VICFA|nr:unnamed protein product [Vicia faba]
MAFLLCNLTLSLLPQSKSRIRDKPFHQTLSSSKPISQCSLFFPSSLSLQTSTAQVAQVNTPLATQDKQNQHQKDDFYLNLGLAVRTLREDMPLIFVKDLNYDIYRDDVTFLDPLNTFTGIEKYKLIFWALRFHGRILFREIGLDVYRIWQPSENVILIRWNLRGVPRVPWEAKEDDEAEFYQAVKNTLDQERQLLQDGLATCS